MGQVIDVQAFKRFEHDGWEQSVEAFDSGFGPLTRQMEPALLAALAPEAGQAALDVATGPGYIALGLEQLGCRATGLDLSEAMIARARHDHPASTVQFVVGDAEKLPFADASFDLVAMNFGILHLAQPEVAAQEAFRVLRPGGRFAFTVWSVPEVSKGFAIALQAIAAHGSASVQLPAGPPFFRYSSEPEGRQLLALAGFRAVRAELISLVWELPDAAALFTAFFEGTARTGGLLRAQPAEHLERIRNEILAGAVAYQAEERLRLPMAAWVYAGVKS